MLVELDRIKKHLNIDTEFTDDDDYLTFLEGVAEDLVQKHIDSNWDEIEALEGGIPQPLLNAILLFIGNMYDNRESVAYSTVTEVPMSLKYILDMYRNYGDCNV